MLEKPTVPQFLYLQSEVITAPILLGENSVKIHRRQLAGSWHMRSVLARIHLECCAWSWVALIKRNIDTPEGPLGDGGSFWRFDDSEGM